MKLSCAADPDCEANPCSLHLPEPPSLQGVSFNALLGFTVLSPGFCTSLTPARAPEPGRRGRVPRALPVWPICDSPPRLPLPRATGSLQPLRGLPVPLTPGGVRSATPSPGRIACPLSLFSFCRRAWPPNPPRSCLATPSPAAGSLHAPLPCPGLAATTPSAQPSTPRSLSC